MVRGWARDIAYALLRLNWSARWNDIRAEFLRGGPKLYPQACYTISREGVDFNGDAGWVSSAQTFGVHSTTSKRTKKHKILIFRHKDGNPSNRGHWELLYYDKEWDEEFIMPEHIESDDIGETILSNPRCTRALNGIDFGDEPGLVYAITNLAWKGWVKVGKTGSITGRKSNYQTGDPHRKYKVRYTRFFSKCGFAEKQAHAELSKSPLVIASKNEWFQTSIAEVERVINLIR